MIDIVYRCPDCGSRCVVSLTVKEYEIYSKCGKLPPRVYESNMCTCIMDDYEDKYECM